MRGQSMARRQPPSGYYTATIAKRKLGNISDGMLRSYVVRGMIERTAPAGRKQGFYKREDVDRIARSLDEFFVSDDKREGVGTRFMQATKEDMPECVELLISVFGGGDTTERRQSWIEKNPEIAFIVRSKGKIVSCAFVLPLLPKKIDAIFADPGSASIASITADDIQALEPGKPVSVYLASIAVRPGMSEIAKRARGQTLLRGLIRFFVSLGSRGIPVKTLAARSELKDGIDLCRHMGFTELESATSQHLFIIEVDRSGVPLAMRYKQAFRRYQAQQSQEGQSGQ